MCKTEEFVLKAVLRRYEGVPEGSFSLLIVILTLYLQQGQDSTAKVPLSVLHSICKGGGNMAYISYTEANEFRGWILKLCDEAGGVKVPASIQEFLQTVLPAERVGQYYALFTADGNQHAQRFFGTIEGYGQALTRVGREPVTTFLCPVSVGRDSEGKLRRRKENLLRAACVCVDIDHIQELGECLAEVSDSVITEWVHNTVSSAGLVVPPAWGVVSGHGVHLYWPTEEIDLRNEEELTEWKQLREMLVAKLGGDRKALNTTQPMRAPGSLNCKDPEHVIKVRLIRLGEPSKHAITDFCLPYDSDYIAATLPQKAPKTPKAPKVRMEKTAAEKSGKEKPAATEEVHVHTVQLHPAEDFKPGHRTLNCLRDMENWFVRRDGEIQGYRHMFAVIYASVCREGRMPEEKAAERMATLFAPGDCCFFNTQCIVHQIYSGELMAWREHYAAIADQLGWTEEEKRVAYAAFSQEEKRAKAAARSKRYYMHKTEEKRGQKAEREEMVLEAMRADADKFGRLTKATLEALITTTGLSERSLRNRWREWLQYGQLVLCEYDKGI